MKTSTQISSLLMIFILAIQLAACGVPAPTPTATETILSSLTPSVVPTGTEQPPTATPTFLIPTLTPSAIPISSPPDELHIAYINNGNLYFQNGSNPPLQLTHNEKDAYPFFSENGGKIFFQRGSTPPFELHSINTDGSEDQALITNKLLRTVDASYTNLTGFHRVTILPSTHLLLFSTYEPQENNSVFWNGDFLVVDTDTAKIRKLPFYASDFFLSPDGKYIARDRIGAIDVLDLEGNIIYENMVIYTPSQPSFLPPNIMWTPDSKGLIILLPVRTFFEAGYISDFKVWRYTLDDGKGIQVPFDILPTEGKSGMVSPDGKWILYNNNDEKYGFYIGDLSTGHAEIYDHQGYISYYWNSDSEHFVYGTAGGALYLGSVDGSPQFIGKGDFLGWLDEKRYFYYVRWDKNIVLGNVDGSQNIVSIHIPETYSPEAFFAFVLPPAQPTK